MTYYSESSDEAILDRLGQRLAATRLSLNLTQAALAEQAGVSKRTVERLESGESATQLSGFLRICRVLGLLDRLDLLVPELPPSPIAQLRLRGRERKRVRVKKVAEGTPKTWTWGTSS